jgi:hypothetical protein
VAVGTLLHDPASGTDHDPATLKVVEIVRFEGTSDPSDEAVMVAVANRDGAPVGTFTTPYGPLASADEAAILAHLHRVIATEEETAEHDAHDHIAAILPNQAAAEAAVDDLREVGLGSEHLGLAVRHGDQVAFERDEEADLEHDLEVGVASGAALGFVAGMLMFAVVVPGIGTIGAAGILAGGAASTLFGTMLGGYLGIGAATEEFYSHEELRGQRLEGDEVLVVACGHHHPDLVEAALRRHGGRVLDATP